MKKDFGSQCNKERKKGLPLLQSTYHLLSIPLPSLYLPSTNHSLYSFYSYSFSSFLPFIHLSNLYTTICHLYQNFIQVFKTYGQKSSILQIKGGETTPNMNYWMKTVYLISILLSHDETSDHYFPWLGKGGNDREPRELKPLQ